MSVARAFVYEEVAPHDPSRRLHMEAARAWSSTASTQPLRRRRETTSSCSAGCSRSISPLRAPSKAREASLRDRKAETSLAIYDIERKNVFAAQGGRALNVAGKQFSHGVEAAVGLRPTREWNLWATTRYTRARTRLSLQRRGRLSANTPPNVPRIVANAGASYRFPCQMPVEIGTAVRHVGERKHRREHGEAARVYGR